MSAGNGNGNGYHRGGYVPLLTQPRRRRQFGAVIKTFVVWFLGGLVVIVVAGVVLGLVIYYA